MPSDPAPLPYAIPLHPVPRGELADAIEAAIIAGADGRLSRGVELFMASCCGPVIADRLIAAGLIVSRPENGAVG